MKQLILSLGLLALAVSAPVMAQTTTSGRETVYRHTPAISTELKHTKLKVQFDYDKEQMQGEAWITARPYFYASDSLILDAKAMLIHEVALDKNGTKAPLKHVYKNDVLKVNLDKTYSRAQDYTVYIKYTARPNEVREKGSAAITDAKGLYFINAQGAEPDKPTQIWTQGETEASSVWFPTIDKPNQKTTQEIYMTVPDKYVTLSNGLLKSSIKGTGGLRTDHWVMDKKHAPYLFFMGVGDYAVVKDKWRNIDVDYYVEKEYEPYAKQIFGDTPAMLTFFSKLLNYDYPWQKFAQMTARDYVSGAMENTTAVLHQESAQQKPGDLIDGNRWEETIAHELFHHWFGDLVTAESWSNLAMNEAFANYSQYLWNEHKYGKDIADYGLMTEMKGYFADPTNPTKDLIRFGYRHREEMFDAVSYNKGGAVVHMLRNYLGDDAFFAGLNDYLKTNEYGTAEAHQLRLSLEKVTGKDLNWFFHQWFYGSGHPKLAYNTTYEPVKKQVTLSIQQLQNGPQFQFPLAVDVYENGKPTRLTFWVDAKAKNDFRFSVGKNPEFINLNADGVLIAEIDEKKTTEQYFIQYQNAKDFLPRYKAVEHATVTPQNATALKLLQAALKDPNFRIRIAALNGLSLSQPEQLKLVGAEVEKIVTADSKTLVQAAAISALAKTKDRKYLAVFEKGMTAISKSVKANSLVGIANIDPARAAKLAETFDLEGVDEDAINALMPLIVEHKIKAQMPAIAAAAAFYPFLKFQDPKLGAAAEDAYQWIMSSDNLKATENITKVLTQVKGQLGENAQAKMMIVQILNDGLMKKMAALKANPSSATLNRQIDLLNAAIAAYR